MITGQTILAILAVITIIQLVACTNINSIKSLSEIEGEDNEFVEQESVLIGKSLDLHNELKQRGLIYRDKQVNDYIKQIGTRLTPGFLQEKGIINIYLLKNATANAAALANGDIYINTGLLTVVDDEDQLASILAHEIGHVIHRHSLKSKLNRQDTVIAARLADILLIGLGSATAAANLAGFSREQEKEADISGLDTLYAAGYVPEKAIEAIKKFQKLPGVSSTKGSIYSTHPENDERIVYLSEFVQQNYTGHNRKSIRSSQYDKVRQKLVELNVQISLTNNQYSLALYLLNEAESYYNRAPLIEHYRGEVYRLMALNPHRAAEDASAIEGKFVSDEAIISFKNAAASNINTARAHYNSALSLNSELAISYRGLGLLEMLDQNNDLALDYLTKYLQLADKPRDSLFIKRLIQDLSKT